ncbi:hypothetical protein [Streptomyces sp. NBC_01615]|uniref:hypothetical protein n=1 Tax=Streptomyces sp. NBC_01615 TaxID=2975898 RepID=UPI0038708490
MRSTPEGLSDQSLVRSLQEFTEDQGEVGAAGIDDRELATAAIDAVLSHVTALGIDSLLASEEQAITVGRNLLDGLASDPDTADTVGSILDDPPVDNRMVTDSLIVSAAVLGAIVAWLQTKFDLKVHRKNGKTEVSLEIEKKPASDSLIKQLATTLWSMLTGGGGPGGGGPDQP